MDNLSQIAAIKFKGGMFQSGDVSDGTDTLELFVNEQDRGSARVKRFLTKSAVVYGKNGAGKSTISKAFMKAKGEVVDTIDDVAFYDRDEKIISLSEEDKKNIVVFNEDFIDKNIKIEEDGLGSIVMLGQDVIDDKTIIAKKEKEIEEKKKEIDSKDIVLDALKNAEDRPEAILDSIHKVLSDKNGNYLKRCREFDGAKSYTEKLKEEFETLIHASSTENITDLTTEYNDKLEEYKKNTSGENNIEATSSPISLIYDENTEQEIIDLLATELEKEDKNDKLGEWIASLGNVKAMELKEELENPEIECCPHCHKEWEAEYRTLLVDAIDQFLSNSQGILLSRIDEKRSLISSIHMEVEAISIDQYDYDDITKYSECNDLIAKIKAELVGLLDKLDEKKNNVSTRVDMEPTEIAKNIELLNAAVVELETEKDAHNKKVNNNKSLKDDLKTLNNKIAYNENLAKITEYKNKMKAIADAQKEFDKLRSEQTALEKELQELNEKTKERKKDIAVGIINEYLNFIFWSEDRIQIEYDEKNDKYRLKSRGKDIGPKQASIGERNIIALCYFFASILQNKRKDKAYNNKYLFVIDDPVSSFDSGNKIGLISFLKRMINEYLEGNSDTRVLITTHDLKSAMDINVVFKELHSKYSDLYWNFVELRNLQLEAFDESRNEYAKMMTLIYQYAENPVENEVYAISIGNMMRRVLEAYGTFTYGVGMAELSTNGKILESLPEEHKKHFENSMYRLFLNGASHAHDGVNELGDNLFFAEFDEDEAAKIAKDTICLLYELNPRHVLSNIKIFDKMVGPRKIYKPESDFKTTIENWVSGIK